MEQQPGSPSANDLSSPAGGGDPIRQQHIDLMDGIREWQQQHLSGPLFVLLLFAAVGIAALLAAHPRKGGARTRRIGSPDAAAVPTSSGNEPTVVDRTATAAVDLPDFAICPISREVMLDPVKFDTFDPNCLHNFERNSARLYLGSDGGGVGVRRHTCPSCACPLRSTRLVPNYVLREVIEQLLASSTTSRELMLSSRRPPSDDDNNSTAAEVAESGMRIDTGFYDGDLDEEGLPHGMGKLHSHGSDYVYEGKFDHGVRHGRGILRSSNGDVYEGEFKNGKYGGRGRWESADGSSKYDGECKNNKSEGTGTTMFANGAKYEGMHKNGKAEGYGTYTWPSGQRYEGEHRNGMLHGRGFVRSTDGTIHHEGRWENNEFIGP